MWEAIINILKGIGSGMVGKVGETVGVEALKNAPMMEIAKNAFATKNPLTGMVGQVSRISPGWQQVGSLLGTKMMAPGPSPSPLPPLPSVNPQQATPRYLQEMKKKQPTIEELIQMIAAGGGR